mgnify:CR=1 FL=1
MKLQFDIMALAGTFVAMGLHLDIEFQSDIIPGAQC